jgi:hypothetical protein
MDGGAGPPAAWLGVAGFACYGTLWMVHQAFYSPFGVSVFMVGVGQAQMVTTAAVFALWFVPLLTYLAVVVRFLFSVKPPRGGRVPVLEAAFGAVLVIGTLMLFARVAVLREAVRVTNGDPSGFFLLAVFVAMVGVLSLALFSRGLAEMLTLDGVSLLSAGYGRLPSWRPSLTTSCRTSYGPSSSPCCPLHPGPGTAAGVGPSPTATASPRSSTCPHLDSLAAAAGPRAWLWLAGDLLAPSDRVG